MQDQAADGMLDWMSESVQSDSHSEIRRDSSGCSVVEPESSSQSSTPQSISRWQ